MKNRKIHDNKKSLLLGVFLLLTNFFCIYLFKKVEMKNIYINDAESISTTDITQNSSLQLPKRLIFIRTKLIEKELAQNFSLRQISVTRQIFPFGLKVNILTRNPVAIAEKEINGKKVKGFVDINGFFIEKKYLPEERLNFPIRIYGWKEEYKKLISLILKNYMDSDDLEVIKISSKGFITLEEKFLQKIFLGFQTQELEEKLNLIFDIREQYKNQKNYRKIKSLDLTDLTNPKIKVFIP